MKSEPVRARSLKDACIARLEEMILSGQYKIGQRLPPERQLASLFQVSRPVVHEALVDLAAKGLVRIAPRKGVFINDFRTTGSPALLTSLLSYSEGDLEPAFFQSMGAFRLLLECETARLAALHRSEEQLAQLAEIVQQEAEAVDGDPRTRAELNFAFHQLLALASGNMFFPLVLNSFKSLDTNLTCRFYARFAGQPILDRVLDRHRQMLAAIAGHDAEAAVRIMSEILHHGLDNS